MGKTKGKVNEKSLDALKKSIKAGGKTRQSKDAKPATPKGRTSQPRSRSRSRTPTRAKKTSPPPKEKKVQPKKSTPTPKVKRLDEEKSANKRPRPEEDKSVTVTKRPRGRPSSTKSPGSYKLRPRIQPSEDEISSSTRTIDESPESLNDSSVTATKGKVQSTTAVDANRGWFSKCIIS